LVCNQIECHPFLNQDKVISACRKHGMAVVAYSPIARGSAKDNKMLEKIGKAHGKTAAQVCLRCSARNCCNPAHQQGRAARRKPHAV
jgi:diketogulonate reductase-like aldo/keto reductase